VYVTARSPGEISGRTVPHACERQKLSHCRTNRLLISAGFFNSLLADGLEMHPVLAAFVVATPAESLVLECLHRKGRHLAFFDPKRVA
jgi:uncharacterized membrane protein YhhN